jgi:hypothetical protein
MEALTLRVRDFYCVYKISVQEDNFFYPRGITWEFIIRFRVQTFGVLMTTREGLSPLTMWLSMPAGTTSAFVLPGVPSNPLN